MRKNNTKEKVSPVKPQVKDNDSSKLLELEKKLALFMLNTEENYVLVDKRYRIVTFNKQFNLLYSKFYGREVLKGHSILDYAQKHTVEDLKKIYKKVFSGKTVEAELEIPSPDGPGTSFLIRYKPAYKENKIIIGAFVSVKDISEIRKARYEQLQSEDKYRSIIEHSLLAFFLTSPEDGGTILQVNKSAVDMFGYSFREFEKLNMQVLFEHGDLKMISGLRKGKKDGKTKGELTGIRKNGEHFPCEYSSVSFKDIKGEIRTTTTVVDISDRKKAENKLKQKEEHLRVIIDNEPECVSVVDVHGKLIEINPAGIKMLQANSGKGIVGKKLSDFIHRKDRKIFSELHTAVLDGENRTASFRITGLKKRQLWMEANSVPLKDHNSKIYAVLSVIRDITSRIESEEKIKESESNLRAIFDNSAEGLMLLDARGRIKAFNAKSAENHILHNVKSTLQVGKKLLDYIDPNRKPYFNDLLTRVLKGESIEYDIDYDRKDGGKCWFHAALSPVWEDGEVTGVCIARNDISERKLAEQKISEAVERYNLVAKATNDSIYDWNLITNEVFRSGDGLSVLFGYESELGHSNSEFWKTRVHKEDYPAVYNKLNATLKNPKLNICNVEYRFRRADGNYSYIFDKGFIIRNEKGKAIRLIGATQDLSDMKATEQQLKDLLNITKDQNKRLQNFAHIVSHNIRSHSSNIIGLVELLNEQDKLKLASNNLFTMLKTSTSKLGETIENLNDIITVQNETYKERKKVYLKSEVDKTCDAINVLISQTNTILHNRIPDKTLVTVIPSYLESILLNLLTNAIKYKSPDRDPVIYVQCKKIKDYLVISIKDNGIGIDLQKNKDKLFGMYKTFHNNKDARGFGLFITKNQVEAMNGKIEVESKLGKGTTFKLYIYEKN